MGNSACCPAVLWGTLLAAAGCSPTEARLSRPNAVVVADTHVYVSDFHHQRIVELDADGAWVGTFGQRGLGRGQLWEVWGLAVSPEGDLHVLNERPTSDRDDARVREIKVFRAGREIQSTVLRGADGEAPPWSDGVGLSPDGGWWLAAQEAGTIVHFGPDGQERRTLPLGGRPSSVRVGTAGLWVVEQFEHRVRHLSPDGHQELLRFGGEGEAPGLLRFPKALAECPGAWVAVADMGNYRVQRFALDGTWLDGFEPPQDTADVPVQLLDLAVSADCGRLFLADSKGDRILMMTPSGELLSTLSAATLRTQR